MERALAVNGDAHADIAALTAHAETIAAETLATSFSFDAAEHPEVEALESGAGQRAVLKAGQYSNSGVLVIDVWKSGAVNV